MIARLDLPVALFGVLSVVSLALPLTAGATAQGWFDGGRIVYWAAAMVLAGAYVLRRRTGFVEGVMVVAAVCFGAVPPLQALAADGAAGYAGPGLWIYVVGLGFLAWRGMELVSAVKADGKAAGRLIALVVPALFGLWLVYLWEVIVSGFGVPRVLLPAPSAIAQVISGATDTLAADFFQTFIKSVLSGYALGCGAGFLVAILVDRVPFLQRGLLPLGNLVSALPIVGVAPIMVMWFGFDWQSKAAVVVIMTFFPMLVNSIAGLAAAGRMEQDLMRSYGAGYMNTLIRLRLPNALPFIFNALKINSTLALIGAIVAEFFGTPIVGMGFRISTEVGRMNVDMVWAEIAVAALSGSLFYGGLALLERGLTFWHPSYRQ